jgi:GH43 family beta-xylosidase
MTPARYYTNPVYAENCPDPFVLKHHGEYWCYSTGFAPDGRCFRMLHSTDLVEWRELGGAMAALPGGAPEYWAPEVAYLDGRFYLYYSVGDGVRMELRAATCDEPGGPFLDAGLRLTPEEFAIDPHVFEDDDGSRYLFYATDFLERSHVGTGTVVDRLIDPLRLAGAPRPVTLARYDSQVFDAHRLEKGGVRWHTLEGPFVLKRKHRYYQMFSGGNWQNPSYGVSYAVASSLSEAQEWLQLEHGERLPLVLATVPGRVIGPGHNSVVRGPDNVAQYCVYHRWSEDRTARVLSIDPLDWAGERLIVLGPSTGPVPAPARPSRLGADPGRWRAQSGRWCFGAGMVRQAATTGTGAAWTPLDHEAFRLELELRAAGETAGDGGGTDAALGIALVDGAGEHLVALSLAGRQGDAALSVRVPGGEVQERWDGRYASERFHPVRLDVDGRRVVVMLDRLSIDGAGALWRGRLRGDPVALLLFTRNCAADFAGVQQTAGWEDLFLEGSHPDDFDWRSEGGAGRDWLIRDGELCVRDDGVEESVLVKDRALPDYELVCNARLLRPGPAPGSYGVRPAIGGSGPGPLVAVDLAGPSVRWSEGSRFGAFPLPCRLEDLAVHRQLRLRKRAGRVEIRWEKILLGEIDAPDERTRVGLYVHRAAVGFDLVRVTALDPGSDP